MTGIERLRELIKDYRSGHECEGIECGELSCGECIAKNVLEPIATQIEREHAEDCYRMVLDHGTVSRVASEMERHVLGHEGMEDSPVARWARELREALGGHMEEVADVATIRKDAYDAYEWVEAHGGLDAVRRSCHDADNCRVELCAALDIDLDKGWSDAMVAMRRRLMPEGMEDMIASYPRFEDGTPALPGMEAVANSGQRSGEAFTIKKAWLENGTWHLSDSTSDGHYWHFKHKNPVVKRPAPKVLDADGAEIRVGDTVWSTVSGDRQRIEKISQSCDGIWAVDDDGITSFFEPSQLTHRAPVLAADGRPLREGETVWKRTNGKRLTVMHLVTSVVGLVGCSDGTEAFGTPVIFNYCPSELTHERPDSWERLEEDVASASCPDVYCANHHIDASDASYEWAMARDIVRRAKALSERDA